MRVTIGRYKIKGPRGHPLNRIYKNRPTYQFEPWKHVAKILLKTKSNYPLLDIGANIGDSAAHFRMYSDAEILCVEADATYYRYLKKNSKEIGNTRALNALVVDDINREYRFLTRNGTGNIADSSEDSETYKGTILKLEDLVHLLDREPCVLKTDCDGYDEKLLSEAVSLIDQTQEFPVIFTEGPSEMQMIKGQWHDYYNLIKKLTERNYAVHIYSNHGEIFETTAKPSMVERYFYELEKGLKLKEGMCHYFDFLFEKRK
jgi:FkbM family methyltransferase